MSEVVSIRHAEDVRLARQAAERLGRELGFKPADTGRLGLIASELASNVVRHGGGGELRLATVSDGGRAGLRLTASDRGPGIPDVELALRPGHSTLRSNGDGLASVKELADALVIDTAPGAGTRIEATRWIR